MQEEATRHAAEEIAAAKLAAKAEAEGLAQRADELMRWVLFTFHSDQMY